MQILYVTKYTHWQTAWLFEQDWLDQYIPDVGVWKCLCMTQQVQLHFLYYTYIDRLFASSWPFWSNTLNDRLKWKCNHWLISVLRTGGTRNCPSQASSAVSAWFQRFCWPAPSHWWTRPTSSWPCGWTTGVRISSSSWHPFKSNYVVSLVVLYFCVHRELSPSIEIREPFNCQGGAVPICQLLPVPLLHRVLPSRPRKTQRGEQTHTAMWWRFLKA